MYQYVYLSENNDGSVRASGINFEEIYHSSVFQINNLLLMRGESLHSTCINNFEILEGAERIRAFLCEDGRETGDLHLVDFQSLDGVKQMSEEEIKDLLYLSHMWRPSKTAFFGSLKNRLAFLFHDDDWNGKLYVQDPALLLSAVKYKVENALNAARRKRAEDLPEIPPACWLKAMEHWKTGLYIDLSGAVITKNRIELKVYRIGHFDDMDDMYLYFTSNRLTMKPSAIVFDNGMWSVS